MKIHRLPEVLVSQIAAGEVIENPSGVIKELVENAIDAESSSISIFVEDDGFKSIQVRDNGRGIELDDLSLAFESFATSKLNNLDDIYALSSLGFRGEALSSIRSVSRATIESLAKGEKAAWKVQAELDQIKRPEPVALHEGTRVIVEDLFFNAPIRREFHKKRKKLKKTIIDLVTDFAIAYPAVSFELHYDGVVLLSVKKAANLINRIEQLFGRDFQDNLIPVYAEEAENYSVEGYISNFSFYKSNASFIRMFVQNRLVYYPRLVGLFRHCYGELMPPGRFPVAYIFLKVPPDELDVNIHPQKREVRFVNENFVYEFLRRSIRHSIDGEGAIPLQNLYLKKRPVLQPSAEPVNEKIDFSLPLIESENYDKGETGKTEKRAITSPGRHLMPDIAHARLYRTFVLASSDEGIFLIDQHTAHERINYELFLKKLAARQEVSQKLLTPLGLSLSPGQKELTTQFHDALLSLGFEISDMGPAGLQLTAIPFYLKTNEEEKAFSSALRLLENNEPGKVDSEILFDELAKSLACRNSVRKGDDESVENLSQLIANLKACKTPGRCPHGRPTMVFLGRDDVFSLFKRKPS